jgi:acetyltransferase-like isoleucine patch superfamily enzyme
MNNILYYLSKFLKKARFSAIKNSKIDSTSKVESGSLIINSIFGKYSYCGYNCEIINTEIGSFCSISNDVKIGGEQHPLNWVSTSPVFYKGRDSINFKFSSFDKPTPKQTIIDSDVWIGSNVLIKQGVKIGVGSVIGMGSVVTKDVKPYSIIAGNPAVLIRKRFDDATIEILLKSSWWKLTNEEMMKIAKYFNNPSEFFNYQINL